MSYQKGLVRTTVEGWDYTVYRDGLCWKGKGERAGRVGYSYLKDVLLFVTKGATVDVMGSVDPCDVYVLSTTHLLTVGRSRPRRGPRC